MSRASGDNRDSDSRGCTDNSTSAGGDNGETLLKTFRISAVEIEDLLKTCVHEYRVSVDGYEIQTLIKEWKALYLSVFGVEPTQEFFDDSEIGRELAQAKLYEGLLRG